MTEFTPDDLIDPVCRPTVDRLQLVFDGVLEANALDTDSHPGVCAACRERIATARLVLSVIATSEPVAMPAGLTERLVTAVCGDRLAEKEAKYRRIRRGSYAGAVGVLLALAASVIFMTWTPEKPQALRPNDMLPRPEPVTPETAPAPRDVAQAKPLRIGDELTKAGIALRVTPKSVTEPASAASDAFAKLTDALTRPISPMPEELEPARSALADLPDVALTGLEPLTDTAQKAFSRLIRDVNTVSVKPKS